jgi:tetratricopeptide (TPR) repeat protein
LPACLRALVAHMIEKDPDKRPQTPAALRVEIEKCLAEIEARLKADKQDFPAVVAESAVDRVVESRPVADKKPSRAIAWAVGVIALLVVIVALVTWQLRGQAEMKADMAKLRQGVMGYAQTEAQVRESHPGEKQMQDGVYVELGKQLGIDAKLLREKLPQFAANLKQAPDASNYERANAAYVAKDYLEAEHLALQAANDARKVPPANSKAIVQALELAGLSAHKEIQYSRAMQQFREAEKLTDVNRNSEEWATLQDAIADLLLAQGKYSEAEKLFRSVIEMRTSVLGPEHPDTLASRHRLIYALNQEEKHTEAEAEARQVVKLREKILGSEHPDTLSSRYNLASVLYHEGKYAEAEAVYREVLKLDETVVGSEDPRTLAARVGLANTLNDQGKYAEAEVSYREVIKLDQKVYGPEHPVTLNDRVNLATALQADGKYSAAEAEYRTAIKLQEKVVGPEHADTLNSRNDLAEMLDDEAKYAEAEAECRQIIGLEEKVVGSEHRLTLNSRGNLAVALIGQGKFEEAETQCRDVMGLMEHTLGLDYPETVNYTVKFVKGFAQQNRLGKAIEIAEGAEERARKALGSYHPVTHQYAKLVQDLQRGKK